jgi:large subunit ribosomal protein L25
MTVNKKKISAKTRESGKKVEENMMPVVLYGAKRKSTPLMVNKKEFVALYEEAGESTLINLEIDDKKEKPAVLVYEIQRDSLTGEIIHADFFEPNLKEEVEAEIPLVFVGDAPAVKDFDGTLVKNMHVVNVKALPQNLPHQIEVNIEGLKTLEDMIHIKDLQIPSDVEILHDKEGVVVMISRPENIEEELEKPIEEEKEVEVIGQKEEKEEGEEQQEEKKEE